MEAIPAFNSVQLNLSNVLKQVQRVHRLGGPSQAALSSDPAQVIEAYVSRAVTEPTAPLVLERQVRKAVEEVCKHNKARQVWIRVEQIISSQVAAKVSRLVDQGANEDAFADFTSVWQQECLLGQRIKVHLGQLQNYVQNDNRDRLRMKQESIGLERSGVKTQALEDSTT